jgi:hypothetical protein
MVCNMGVRQINYMMFMPLAKLVQRPGKASQKY